MERNGPCAGSAPRRAGPRTGAPTSSRRHADGRSRRCAACSHRAGLLRRYGSRRPWGTLQPKAARCAMAFKYIVVAVIAAAFTLFALQNNAPTAIRFLIWQLDAVPLAGIMLVSVALGVPLLVERWRLRSRLRALESRLGAEETVIGEQDRAPTQGGPSDG